MKNTNQIRGIKNPDGSLDYVVSLGDVLYNDRVVSLRNLVIPLSKQRFFTLPEDKNKYATVNVYYDVEKGGFVFDTVRISAKFVESVNAQALTNVVPVAQFVLRQKVVTFEVIRVNEYSKMATFAITTEGDRGEDGLQGPRGETGAIGHTGPQGETGIEGYKGITGYPGLTGIGIRGETGPQGETGVSPDRDLLLYHKMDADDAKQPDTSLYRIDMEWGATGAGITGVTYTGLEGYSFEGSFTGMAYTGIQFFPTPESSRSTEDGILGERQDLVFQGGKSAFKAEEYLHFGGYTGTIQAWIKLNPVPIADFEFEVDGLNVDFTDTSMFSPDTWLYNIEGLTTRTTPNPDYTFPTSGEYLVTLTVTNVAGSTSKTKLVVV